MVQPDDIFTASFMGECDKVRQFLDDDPSLINSINDNGDTPLCSACSGTCRKNVIELLLERGARADIFDRYGMSPLYNACEFHFDAEIVRLLVEHGADPRAYSKVRYKERFAPIHAAAYGGACDIVKYFIGIGVDTELRTKDMCETPLMVALKIPRHIEIIECLLSNGAKLESRDIYGCTALAAACRYDSSLDMINMLLEHGADVNSKSNNGITPFHIACDGRTREVVLALIDKIKDVNEPTGMKALCMTPLHIACASNSEDTVELLLEHGADINAIDLCGRTPLHIARANRRVNITKILLCAGATIGCPPGDDRFTETRNKNSCDVNRMIGKYVEWINGAEHLISSQMLDNEQSPLHTLGCCLPDIADILFPRLKYTDEAPTVGNRCLTSFF